MDHGQRRRDTPSHPYVGHRPYTAAERQSFFGRASDAVAIASLWSHNRLTIVQGSAGVGKSSLINAGVLPLLDDIKFNVLPIGHLTLRSAFPVAAQFDHNPYTNALLSSWAPAQTLNQLSRTTISGFLRLQQRHRPVPVMAAIDQFEELFHGAAERRADRARFYRALMEALRHHPDLHLLIITRKEWSTNNEFLQYLDPDAEFEVSALSREAAIDAARLPVSRTARTFPIAAAEFLVDQLSMTRAGPPAADREAAGDEKVNATYLQIACSCLWEALPDNLHIIDTIAVKEYLNLDGCISDFASGVIARTAVYYNLDISELATSILETFAYGNVLSSVAITSSGSKLISSSVAQTLEDYHILCSDVQSGNLFYELATALLIFPLRVASRALETTSRPSGAAISAIDLIDDAKRAFSLGELDTVGRIATDAIQSLPIDDRQGRAEMETLLGNRAYLNGDFQKSHDSYAKSAKLFEMLQDQHAVGQLLAAIGNLQMRDWDLAAAIMTLQSAVIRLPAEDGIKIELARAFAVSGEPNAAIAVLESVPTTKADVGGGDARILRGEILVDLGESARAIRDLEEVPLESVPSVHAAKALALAELGRFSDAEKAIEQALEVGHHSGPVLLRAARLRALRGDRSGADSLVSEALKANEPKLSEYQRRQATALRDRKEG